jgi:hypothetical protein
VKGVDGHVLKHYRFGKRISVTLPDLMEFGAYLAEHHTAEKVQAAPARRTPRKSTAVPRTEEQRKLAAAAAISELRGAGIA